MHFFLDSDTLMKKCTNMKRFINLIDLSYWEGQCCGSMIDWYGSGSGSADPCLYLIDPDPAIFVIDLQDANKKLIKKSFPAYYYLKVYLHNFSKIKSQKGKTPNYDRVFMKNIFLLHIFVRWPPLKKKSTECVKLRSL